MKLTIATSKDCSSPIPDSHERVREGGSDSNSAKSLTNKPVFIRPHNRNPRKTRFCRECSCAWTWPGRKTARCRFLICMRAFAWADFLIIFPVTVRVGIQSDKKAGMSWKPCFLQVCARVRGYGAGAFRQKGGTSQGGKRWVEKAMK